VVTCYLAWGHGDKTWWSLVIWHGGMEIKLGGHLLFKQQQIFELKEQFTSKQIQTVFISQSIFY
jgi:hypothetical protein